MHFSIIEENILFHLVNQKERLFDTDYMIMMSKNYCNNEEFVALTSLVMFNIIIFHISSKQDYFICGPFCLDDIMMTLNVVVAEKDEFWLHIVN